MSLKGCVGLNVYFDNNNMYPKTSIEANKVVMRTTPPELEKLIPTNPTGLNFQIFECANQKYIAKYHLVFLVRLRSKQFLKDDYHSVIYLQTLGKEEQVTSTRNKHLLMKICTVLKEIPSSWKAAVQITYSFIIANKK